jgi:hypothetical protein
MVMSTKARSLMPAVAWYIMVPVRSQCSEQDNISRTDLGEFGAAGFSDVDLLRTTRNARTRNPWILAAEVDARK